MSEFLSRVFGLHSVYTQVDSYARFEPSDEESILMGDMSRPRPLLDSESDSDSENEREEERGKKARVRSPERSRVIGQSRDADKVHGALDNQSRVLLGHDPPDKTRAGSRSAPRVRYGRERALYLWANIINMDEFLTDVYVYYRKNGLVNTVLSRVVELVIVVFVLFLGVFLWWGVDYDKIRGAHHKTMADLVIGGFLWKMPLLVRFLLFGFGMYVILRSVQLYFDWRYKLREMGNFFRELVCQDDELATISWRTVVERLVALKDHNSLTSSGFSDLNSKVRLNAHDIANRVLRRENYMVAMVNRGIFAFSPRLLTKTLEWNLQLCINNFVFDRHGQICPEILREGHRNRMAHELARRFRMAALINLALCPFLVVYFVLVNFFRYFNEYKSNPSSLGLRQYTPYAQWKLREYNELPHIFERRLALSEEAAAAYIGQFPRTALVENAMRLVNFVCGAFVASLVIIGLFVEDEEHSFWSFELVEGRSVLFFISVLGTIWAITGQTEETGYDPEGSLRKVAEHTHYLPSRWNGRLHTAEVRGEFTDLYSLRVVVVLYEILSVVMTPFVLWRVSASAGQVVDFFRDFSVHVEGLGYVCYYAMFDFEEGDRNMMKMKVQEAPKREKKNRVMDEMLSDYYQDDKMAKSYMYFVRDYGEGVAGDREERNGGGVLGMLRTMSKYR